MGQRGPGGDGEEAGRLGLARARARRVTGVPGCCPAGACPRGERQETAAEEIREGGGELPAPWGRQGAVWGGRPSGESAGATPSQGGGARWRPKGSGGENRGLFLWLRE